MRLALIKAQSSDIADPAIPKLESAVLLVNSKLSSFASNDTIFDSNDTIQEKLERAELIGSPDLDPRRKLKVRNPALQLNDVFDTDEGTKSEQDNADKAYNKVMATAYMELYFHDGIKASNEPSYVTITPPGYTAAEKSYVGQDGQNYTKVLDEDGNLAYLDTKASCVMPKAGLAASTPAMINDDLIPQDRMAEINTKIDKDGKIVARDANDAAIQLALARNDAKYIELPKQLDMIERITAEVSGATTYTATPSGIKTDAKPSAPFATAVTAADAPAVEKSIMFQTPRATAPWEKPTVAANAPTFEPSI